MESISKPKKHYVFFVSSFLQEFCPSLYTPLPSCIVDFNCIKIWYRPHKVFEVSLEFHTFFASKFLKFGTFFGTCYFSNKNSFFSSFLPILRISHCKNSSVGTKTQISIFFKRIIIRIANNEFPIGIFYSAYHSHHPFTLSEYFEQPNDWHIIRTIHGIWPSNNLICQAKTIFKFISIRNCRRLIYLISSWSSIKNYNLQHWIESYVSFCLVLRISINRSNCHRWMKTQHKSGLKINRFFFLSHCSSFS